MPDGDPRRETPVSEKPAYALQPDDAHNRELVRNVHPPDWRNPEPASRYQLVVIGAGAGGLVSAVGAAGLGAKVAIVERHLLGGDCLNVGCVPSKALLRSARCAAEVRRAGEFGVRVPEGVTVDFPAVMERMRRLRAQISPADSAERLKGLGIDVFFGQATFTGQETLRVGEAELPFGRAIVATGGRPAVPDIPGLEQAECFTNESIFTLTELPRRLAVMGGGPVGCELAQAFARFGSQVTLLSHSARLLPRDDPEAAELVRVALVHDGCRVLLQAETSRVEPGPPRRLHATVQGTPTVIEADAILVAAGRRPNVEGLGLDAAGVEFNGQGLVVDDRLRTSNPRIYGVGDVASQYKFTHAADALARVAIQNALTPLGARAGALVIPWCTYTDPEVAHVGILQEEAARQGVAFETFTHRFAHVDRAILEGETDGFVRFLVQKRTGRLLGATVVGPHAGDLISEATLALSKGLGVRGLAGTIHPYPSVAEGLKKAAEAWNRTRLTPTVKSLLKAWLHWFR